MRSAHQYVSSPALPSFVRGSFASLISLADSSASRATSAFRGIFARKAKRRRLAEDEANRAKAEQQTLEREVRLATWAYLFPHHDGGLNVDYGTSLFVVMEGTISWSGPGGPELQDTILSMLPGRIASVTVDPVNRCAIAERLKRYFVQVPPPDNIKAHQVVHGQALLKPHAVELVLPMEGSIERPRPVCSFILYLTQSIRLEVKVTTRIFESLDELVLNPGACILKADPELMYRIAGAMSPEAQVIF